MHVLFSLLRIRACTCFEHYLLILRRRYTSGTWYTACVLCQMAATRIGVELVPEMVNCGGTSLDTYWSRGSVNIWNDMKGVENKKTHSPNFCPYREPNHDSSNVEPVCVCALYRLFLPLRYVFRAIILNISNEERNDNKDWWRWNVLVFVKSLFPYCAKFELNEAPGLLLTPTIRTENPLQLKKQNYYIGLKANTETNWWMTQIYHLALWVLFGQKMDSHRAHGLSPIRDW
jgi:hypothetical protein